MIWESLKEIAEREKRSVAATARLILGSGLVRYRERGHVLLDRAASNGGELVLFPLRLQAPRGDS